MPTPRDGPRISRGKPGPKPRGRSVVPLTIAVTTAQRTLLDEMAERQRCSISAVVRQFIMAGLAAHDEWVPAP